MSLKYLLLILGITFCAQCTLCNVIRKETDISLAETNAVTPVNNKLNNEEKNSSSSEEEELDEHAKLFIVIAFGIFELAEATVKPGQKLLENVIADIGTMTDVDGKPYPKIVKMKEIVDKMNKAEASHDFSEQMDMFQEYAEFMEQFDDMSKINHTPKDQEFIDSIKKNGYEAIETEFNTMFASFADKVRKAVDNYWKSLSAEEQKENNKLGDWLTKVNNEKEEWLTKVNDEKEEEKVFELFTELFEILLKEK